MAFYLLTYPFKACNKIVRYVFLLFMHLSLKFISNEGVKLWSEEAPLAQEIINAELQFLCLSVFQFMENTTSKLKQVNKAIDQGVLASIAFAPIKIFINAFKTALKFLLIFIVKHVVQKNLFSEVETHPLSSIALPSLPRDIIGRTTGSGDVFQLKDYLNWKVKSVNKALDEAVPLKHPKKIREAMRHSLLLDGGRVRPILCIASCQLVGGDEALAMPMACAIEIIHISWLIIEDLPYMGTGNDFRGGEPTTHKLFGEEVTLLASAALFSIAFEHVAKNSTHVPQDRVVQAIAELSLLIGTEGLVGNQSEKLMSGGNDITPKDIKYIRVHRTTRLLEASLVCGAIIGGASVSDVEKIRKYARRIGLLFQVEEDFNVMTSKENVEKFSNKYLMSSKGIFRNLIGMDDAKKFAGTLVTQAIRELSHFDPPRAAPLNHLAYYIANGQY